MLTGISLFSGIGGAAYGMQQAGVKILASVEYDPCNTAYSQHCKEMHDRNFPGSEFIMRRVEEVADDLPRCDILQASPVCKNFSLAGNFQGNQETLEDEGMAQAVVRAIASTQPIWFMLEQVPGYTGTKSLATILKYLYRVGYSIRSKILDVADYGIPQNRKRFFLLASKGVEPWEFPSYRQPMGWYEAIAGIPLARTNLTERQYEALIRFYSKHESDRGVLVQRVGLHRNLLVRGASEPCWTLTRSTFNDHKGGTRQAVMTVADDDGAFNVPIRGIARLGGFPDSFALGRYAGEGIGYSVPPKFSRLLVRSINGSMQNSAVSSCL